jgi:prepilin-type N-terminal cleavage/methylation domain-containing protein
VIATTHHTRHGFTLAEVLVAMTLGLLVLMLAIAMLGRTQDDCERIGSGVSAEREARAVLTQLTADLNTARFHKDSRFEQSRTVWPSDQLGFLSLQAADAQSPAGRIGDLCAIHYYLKDLVVGGKTVRCLMRGFHESDTTFKALREDQAHVLFTGTARDEPVAMGVLSFEARPQTCDAAGQWQAWDKSSLEPPAALAVRLVIARRELLGKLADAEAWNGTGEAANLLGMASQASTNSHLAAYSNLIRFGHPAAIRSQAASPPRGTGL